MHTILRFTYAIYTMFTFYNITFSPQNIFCIICCATYRKHSIEEGYTIGEVVCSPNYTFNLICFMRISSTLLNQSIATIPLLSQYNRTITIVILFYYSIYSRLDTNITRLLQLRIKMKLRLSLNFSRLLMIVYT